MGGDDGAYLTRACRICAVGAARGWRTLCWLCIAGYVVRGYGVMVAFPLRIFAPRLYRRCHAYGERLAKALYPEPSDTSADDDQDS